MLDIKTDYTITPLDRFNLSYGALLGYCLVHYLSGRLLISVAIGIPMGIGGMAFAIVLMRFIGIDGDQVQQRKFVRDNTRGVVFSVAIALVFALAMVLWIFPSEDRAGSVLFLVLAGLYLSSYIVQLIYFGDNGSVGLTGNRRDVERSKIPESKNQQSPNEFTAEDGP